MYLDRRSTVIWVYLSKALAAHSNNNNNNNTQSNNTTTTTQSLLFRLS
jgi:hypothetical protein